MRKFISIVESLNNLAETEDGVRSRYAKPLDDPRFTDFRDGEYKPEAELKELAHEIFPSLSSEERMAILSLPIGYGGYAVPVKINSSVTISLGRKGLISAFTRSGDNAYPMTRIGELVKDILVSQKGISESADLMESDSQLPEEIRQALSTADVDVTKSESYGDGNWEVHGTCDGEPVALRFMSWSQSDNYNYMLHSCDDGCTDECRETIQNHLRQKSMEEAAPVPPMKPGEEKMARQDKNANRDQTNNAQKAPEDQKPMNPAENPEEVDPEFEAGMKAAEDAKKELKSKGVIESFIKESVEKMFEDCATKGKIVKGSWTEWKDRDGIYLVMPGSNSCYAGFCTQEEAAEYAADIGGNWKIIRHGLWKTMSDEEAMTDPDIRHKRIMLGFWVPRIDPTTGYVVSKDNW